MTLTGDQRRARLAASRLYVLLDGAASVDEFTSLAGTLVDAGVDVLQLRDKQLGDRLLLQRGRLLRKMTASTQTLFIMNDRADLAWLAEADGVHVGQEELPVAEVRRLLGRDPLIGVSTHDLDQVREAELAGADYIGCGPTFPSRTKQFSDFAGLSFLRDVAQSVRVPAFAIGGIDASNVEQVRGTGISRIAVGAAVTRAADPVAVVKSLCELLSSI